MGIRTVLWREGLELEPKGPGEDLLIEIDWTDKLGSATLSNPTVSVEAGMTVTQHSNTTTTQIVKLSGGTAGEFYEVTVAVDAGGGEQHFERSFIQPVADL